MSGDIEISVTETGLRVLGPEDFLAEVRGATRSEPNGPTSHLQLDLSQLAHDIYVAARDFPALVPILWMYLRRNKGKKVRINGKQAEFEGYGKKEILDLLKGLRNKPRDQ